MKFNFKDKKGVVILTAGETENIAPYEDYEELIKLVERYIKAAKNGVDVIEFEKKIFFTVYDTEDLEELKKEMK